MYLTFVKWVCYTIREDLLQSARLLSSRVEIVSGRSRWRVSCTKPSWSWCVTRSGTPVLIRVYTPDRSSLSQRTPLSNSSSKESQTVMVEKSGKNSQEECMNGNWSPTIWWQRIETRKHVRQGRGPLWRTGTGITGSSKSPRLVETLWTRLSEWFRIPKRQSVQV